MNSIQQKGYALVVLPAEDLKPLYLLEKVSNGSAQNIHSHIKDLFEPKGKPLPSVTKNAKAPSELKSSENVDLSAGANFNFLKALLRFFSGSASVSTSLQNQGAVQLQMKDLRKDYVSLIELESFIQQARPVITESYLQKLEKGELFVITEVLKTVHFTMGEEKKNDFKVNAGVQSPELADAKADISYTKERDSLMEGNDVAVGLKAYQLFYRNGKYTLKYADQIQTVRGENFPGEKLAAEEGLLTIQTN